MKKSQFFTVISRNGEFEARGFATVKAVVNYVAMVSVGGWVLENFGRVNGGAVRREDWASVWEEHRADFGLRTEIGPHGLGSESRQSL